MKNLVLFLFITLIGGPVYCQYDTVHYIAPSAYNYFSEAHEIIISTLSTSSVSVDINKSDGTFIANVNVSKGSPIRHGLTGVITTAQWHPHNMVLPAEGLIIEANQPVSVNVRNKIGNTYWAFPTLGKNYRIKGNSSLTSKGLNALGKEFRLIYFHDHNQANGFEYETYSIMAVSDNTDVLKDGLALVTLNKGESYLLSGNPADNNNLGDLITSNKEITITICNEAERQNVGGNCIEPTSDQLIPVRLTGTEYIVVRGNGVAKVEEAIIMATTDNTSYSINNGPQSLLVSAGDYVEISNGVTKFDTKYITSDKPIYVVQGAGSGCEHGVSVLPPLTCTGSNHIETFVFNDPTGQPNLNYDVFILTKCASIPSLNGLPLTNSNPVNGTDWSLFTFNQANVTSDSMILDSQSPMHVGILQNGGPFGQFAYFSGFDKSEILIEASSVSGDSILQEGCEGASFTFKREISCGNDTILISLSGSATEGVDFNTVPKTLFFMPGLDSVYVPINAIADGLDEPQESLTVTILIDKNCDGILDTTRSTLYIDNYKPMVLAVTDTLTMCIDPDHTFVFEEGTLQATVVDGGLRPYTFTWEGGFTQTIASPPYTSSYVINSNTGIFPPIIGSASVKVSDRCGEEVFSEPIILVNQCPWVVPNIFTPNGDGQNDFFVAANSEQYKNSHLTVFNRWGVKVFESKDYQNDWDGDDLSDGVYYYILTNPSLKLEEKKGFFHLLR